MNNAELLERPLPRPGDIVGGKYRLLQGIANGGMGLIYEATHIRLGQRVAIKFMLPKLVGHADSVARFEREGRAASSLTSPHAVRIVDVDVAGGIPYIVSEFLVGCDLRSELEQRRRLPITEAVTYAIQVCAAMSEAHANGIVHRDLKPSNLFLADTPTGRTLKVVDFGIAKVATDEELDLTTTGVTLGSPRYMSPEQTQAKPADRRADVWSLGIVLFRSLADAYPFEGDTALAMAVATLSEKPRDIRELVPEAPAALAAAISKALERDVDRRFDTMRDFADALAPFAPPALAALAASLTRDIAVPSQRISTRELARASGVSARASMVDTEASPALFDDPAVPIDVDPTEHVTSRSQKLEMSGVHASTRVDEPRRRARWKAPVAVICVAVLLAGVATVAVPRLRAQKAIEATKTDAPPVTAPAVAAASVVTVPSAEPAPSSSAVAPQIAPVPVTRPAPEPRRAPVTAAPPPAAPSAKPHKNPNYL